MKLFFLFFISFIFNSFCEFVIKWKRLLNNSVSDETIFYNLINNIILFDIQVGSKKEKISFQIIFNEYAFTLIGSDTETSIKKYNYKESKSYKNISDIKSYYFSFFKECYQSTENFIINDKKINNLKFVLTTKLDEFFDDFLVTQTGYFGLQISPRSLADDLIDFAIIKQLKANKVISSYTFKIVYDNKNKDLNDNGKIVLGEKDYEKNFLDKFITIKAQIFSSHLEWGFSVDKVTYGDIEVKAFQNLVKFCIENAAILGTDKFHDIIYEEFFNDTINDNICFKKEIYPFIFYYCNKDVDISNFKELNFELKDINFTFSFNKNDLFYDEGNYKYFLVVFTIHSTDWIFGRPFFKKYGDNFIFDQDKNLMVMYKNQKNNSDEKRSNFVKKFFIVILVIAIIFLIVYIIKYYIKYKKNRKKAFEIEDNYEYNSQEDYKNSVSKLLMN